jgi:SRSO17 transposase
MPSWYYKKFKLIFFVGGAAVSTDELTDRVKNLTLKLTEATSAAMYIRMGIRTKNRRWHT